MKLELQSTSTFKTFPDSCRHIPLTPCALKEIWSATKPHSLSSSASCKCQSKDSVCRIPITVRLRSMKLNQSEVEQVDFVTFVWALDNSGLTPLLYIHTPLLCPTSKLTMRWNSSSVHTAGEHYTSFHIQLHFFFIYCPSKAWFTNENICLYVYTTVQNFFFPIFSKVLPKLHLFKSILNIF